MNKINSSGKKNGQSRSFLIMLAVVAVWVAMPLIVHFGTTTALADHGPHPALVAQLTGEPIDGITPRGFSTYTVDATATPDPARTLVVNISNVNLPDGTELSVALNSAAIGTITLDVDGPENSMGGHGSLRLSTVNGDTVPEVAAGDTLTVGTTPAAGAATYLSGTFAAPATPSPSGTHTPFPSPSHTPFPTPSHTPFPTPSHTPFPTPSHTPFPTPSPMPARNFAARMNGASEVPPVTTNGQGVGFVSLNSDETQIRVCVGFRSLSSDVTTVTINGPAAADGNGPVIFTLTLPTSLAGFASQTFDVTADQVTDLRAGMWYFQVATVNNPGGEIRGQITAIIQHGPGHGGHHGGGGDGDGPGGPGGDDLAGSDDSGSMDRSVSYIAAPFDFDEDGITDIAVFHQADGNWYVTRSSDGKTVLYRAE